jgi:hypothetical protein
VVLVLVRRQGMWDSLRSALGGGPKVAQSHTRAEPIE